MRVFLKVGKTVKKPSGGDISWPAEAFCEVEDELGKSWLKAGDALPATERNEIVEESPKAEKAEDKPKPESGDGEDGDEEKKGRRSRRRG